MLHVTCNLCQQPGHNKATCLLNPNRKQGRKRAAVEMEEEIQSDSPGSESEASSVSEAEQPSESDVE